MIVPDPAAQPALRRPGGGPFDGIDFVIVDVETTGWSPDDAHITEIGAVQVRGGQVCGQFASLINPGSAIPAQISVLTGISDAMVAMAPSLRRVMPAFLDFARGRVLTAHNAPFDLSFLTAACLRCGLPWPEFDVLDTADLARRLLPVEEVADCKLSTLATHFGTAARPRHRALADALATADVLTELLARLARTGISTLPQIATLADLRGEHTHPGSGAPVRPPASRAATP